MFVKRATLSRCMSLFQTVTCTSSVSDDNAFMHVLFPAQPKDAVPLSFRRPCPVILPWGSQLLPLISFPSSYLHLPIFYLIVSYLLFPHYIIVLTHNTLIPPHASRRWVWEPLEADKFNVESRDTHYKQEKKNLCKARRLEQESGLEFQWGWVGGQLQSFTNQNDMTALCGPRPVNVPPHDLRLLNIQIF